VGSGVAIAVNFLQRAIWDFTCSEPAKGEKRKAKSITQGAIVDTQQLEQIS